jgi:hypothetical protein
MQVATVDDFFLQSTPMGLLESEEVPLVALISPKPISDPIVPHHHMPYPIASERISANPTSYSGNTASQALFASSDDYGFSKRKNRGNRPYPSKHWIHFLRCGLIRTLRFGSLRGRTRPLSGRLRLEHVSSMNKEQHER